MREKKIVIEINCHVSKVFDFTTDPTKTHLWIDNIIHEERNESPTGVGTEYRNLNKQGKWVEYEVVRFKKNKIFEIKQKNGSYSVRYTYEPISKSKTRLTYFEWVDEGDLEDPFSLAALEKLKNLIENQ